MPHGLMQGSPLLPAPAAAGGGGGGGGVSSHHDLTDLGTYDDHAQYVNVSASMGARTITAVHAFSPGSASAPFTLGSNALGQLVTGLNADKLDGSDASDFAAASHTHAASAIASGQVALARGGTGADMSATGGARQVVMQESAGATFTARLLVAADIPDLSATYQPLDADLTAIAAFSSTGIAVRTASNTWAQRTLTAGSSKISVSNGNGVSGNPTVDVTEANLSLANIGGTLAKSQISSSGTFPWAEVSKTSSSLADLATRSAGDLNSGTLPVARLDTDTRRRSFQITLSSPAVGGVRLGRIPWGCTVKRLGSYTDTGTVTFNVEERSTLGSSGTNILSSDQAADTDGEEVTSSFNLGTLTSGRWLYIDISAVASSPTQVAIWLEVEV